MAPADDPAVERLYAFGESLNAAKDKAKNEGDYRGIIAAASGSNKAKQLAAQLIPRFFKLFPQLSADAINAQLDLCEEEELGIRVQAIRGLPVISKDTPEHLPKIADVLGQLLVAEESLERDAVQKALMQVLRQDCRASLTALFKHVESPDENVREKVLIFIKEKVFTSKRELLQPKPEMERHITDLTKKILQDVTGAEFKMFIDFLKSLDLFSEKAPPEQVQELVQIIEGQADLQSKFELLKDEYSRLQKQGEDVFPLLMLGSLNEHVTDEDHLERVLSCLQVALPLYALSPERQLNLLKLLAESSSATSASDARQLLPAVSEVLKSYLPTKKSKDPLKMEYIECLLYAFHQLAHKAPNVTNSLCGYKIVTGQPSDRLGEDFSDRHKEWIERLNVAEEVARAEEIAATKQASQQEAALRSTTDEAGKTSARAKVNAARAQARVASNTVKLANKDLRRTVPQFSLDSHFTLSWQDQPKAVPGLHSVKRPATGASNGANVQEQGGKRPKSNQLVARALQGLPGGVSATGGRGSGHDADTGGSRYGRPGRGFRR
eukprot:SM000147S01133  [mRNA]  locus=s147:256652:261253:- [translate_table: standard]